MFESLVNALSHFHFIRPVWLLAIVPLLLLWIGLLLARANRTRWSAVIDPGLLGHLLDTSGTVKKRWPLSILGLGWLICCIALAGPSWQRLPQVVEKKTDVLLVIVDMTLSMYATDVRPSRLLRARYKLLELLAQRKEGQTALIAYSGDAHVVSPLTDDSKTVAALIPALSPKVMPSIGSNAGAAFKLAAELLASQGAVSARVVWLTDELLAKDRGHIESLVKRYSVELVALGIGSEQGGLIKLPDGKFIKDNDGNPITAKLNRSELQQFVSELGGRYIDLRPDNSDVEYMLSKSLFIDDSVVSASDADSQRTVERWRDQGAWLVLLLIPIVLFSFRRGWVIAIACVAVWLAPVENSYALTWQDLWLNKDQQAKKMLEQGDAEQAAELFKDKQWQGIAKFESGNYAESVKSLTGVNNADAHYNRGHALAHDGKLEEAVAAYDKALALDPNMEDAKKSKSIIEQLLQQQQNQPGDGQGENGDQQQDGSNSDQSKGSNSENQPGQESDSEPGQQDASQAQTSDESGQHSQTEQNSDGEASAEDQQSLASSENEPGAEQNENDSAPPLSEAEQLSAQQSQALQQWLRQIPDDPAGLLRRKFQYERQLRQRDGTVVESEEDGQIW